MCNPRSASQHNSPDLSGIHAVAERKANNQSNVVRLHISYRNTAWRDRLYDLKLPQRDAETKAFREASFLGTHVVLILEVCRVTRFLVDRLSYTASGLAAMIFFVKIYRAQNDGDQRGPSCTPHIASIFEKVYDISYGKQRSPHTGLNILWECIDVILSS